MLLAACGSESSLEPIPGAGAVLTVIFPSHAADTLHVFVTDSATIAKADAFIRTGSGPRMLTGKIARGAGIDAKYPFHYLPETVTLADVGIEICDGAPMRTAKDVDDFFVGETGSAASEQATWCPWDSKPIAITRLANL
jgi:hypothetical protein